MIGGGISQCPPEHQTLEEKLTEATRKIYELSKALGVSLSHNSNLLEKTVLVCLKLKS